MMSTKLRTAIMGDMADLITHAGQFHADEVMATAIIAEMSKRDRLVVHRATSVDHIAVQPTSIVYDIGGGQYDHHQPGRNGHRPTDGDLEIPYSSVGLIWRDYGINCCYYGVDSQEDAKRVWQMVDEELIKGIDALDNGVYPASAHDIQLMSINSIISGFNTNWDENSNKQNDRFLEAVELARMVFRNVLRNATSRVKARTAVIEAIKAAHDGVMIMDTFMPWINTFFSMEIEGMKKTTDSIYYVIFPSNRGGYQWRVVPLAPGSFEQRVNCPQEWWGKVNEELVNLTGIPSAQFCHANGFTGTCGEMVDAINMAKLAIEKGKKNF